MLDLDFISILCVPTISISCKLNEKSSAGRGLMPEKIDTILSHV